MLRTHVVFSMELLIDKTRGTRLKQVITVNALSYIHVPITVKFSHSG